MDIRATETRKDDLRLIETIFGKGSREYADALDALQQEVNVGAEPAVSEDKSSNER